MKKLDPKLKSLEEKTTITDKLQKWGGFFEPVKRCRIRLSRRFRRRAVGSLCAVTMLATTLASAIPSVAYAEVIKRNATASTTAMVQNYLNKGTSSLADLSYSRLLSNGSKYSFITDTTLLPTLYSNWRVTDVDSWYFCEDDGSVKTGWVYDHGWYYLSTEDEGTAGLMKYGWYQDRTSTWYFLNTIHDGTFGRAVSGWQWIDGYSYFFDENCRLVVSGSTTDGYTVDNDGRWTVDGVVQYVEGKGLTSQIVYLDSNTASSVASDSTSTSDDDSSGSSNGSGDNSTSSGSGTASGDNNDSTNTDSTDSDSTSKDEKDTDGDGVPDWLEEYLGTSSASSDTDGDGISDYDEIYIIGSDPTANDSNEDADSDGISNFDEINTYKTDPTSKDTDGDTLSDYDEIFVHYTDPLKADTDGDGISDADEIGYGFDPLVADSDGNGTPDGRESITITASYDGESIAQPTAQITLQAGVAASVNIERDDPITSIWMTEDVPGMLDAMYDFTVDGEIEEATLTFHFTEDESADFYPAIYYVDTENQVMTELENQVVEWEAKTVTATTNHFSGYVTLNKVEQDRAWDEEILYYLETSDKLDVAFAIDESRSVASIDVSKERIQLASKVMDALPKGSRVSVSGFVNYARGYQLLTDDMNMAKNALTNIENGVTDKGMTLSHGILAGMIGLGFDMSFYYSPSTIMSTASVDEKIGMEVVLDELEEYEMAENEIAEDSEAIQETTIEMEVSIATTSDATEQMPKETSTDETVQILQEIITDEATRVSMDEKSYEDDAVLATISDASIEGALVNDSSEVATVLAGAAEGVGVASKNKKIIVLITDAKGTYFAPTVQEAIDNGVTIYTVGLGDSGSTSLLESIASQTGGSYYHSSQIDSLVSEIQKMSSKQIDMLTDSDGDGISDYYEDRIRLFTGKKLVLDKNNPDTDGDGVRDGDEIAFIASRSSSIANADARARYISAGASSSIQADGGGSYVSDSYHKLSSNPTLVDTDFDGRDDSVDAKPRSNKFYGLLNTDRSLCNIDFTMDFRYFFADNTKYNQKLSNVSILFAADMYESYKLRVLDEEKKIVDLFSDVEELSLMYGLYANELYKQSISEASIMMEEDMYERAYKQGELNKAGLDFTMGDNITMVLDFFGFSNTTDIKLTDKYDDDHMSEVGLGHRTVTYNGETKTILAVMIRGTNGTIQEWASNFNIGNIDKFDETEDWQVEEHHIGFDVVANRIMREVDAYVDEHGLDPKELTYWITGHSRGAGIANIIGANYEAAGRETFVYGFATPNTTRVENTSDYKSIFNIVNGDDLVPTMPMEAWGYKKYGRTAIVSVNDNHKAEWEEITNLTKISATYWLDSYSGSPENRNRAVNGLTPVLAINSDPREEAFKYTCSCHGDGSDDSIIATGYVYASTKEAAYDGVTRGIPENMREYCMITIGEPVTRYTYIDGAVEYFEYTTCDVKICQTPAYLMQMIAAQMAGIMGVTGFPIHDVATRYEDAKGELIWSSLSLGKSRGDELTHPHYTESYYVLSNHIKAGDFK